MSEAAAPSGIGPGAGIARVLSDDRLAQRAVTGDDRAFAAIFDRYHQSLYRYCLAILGDSQDAQDALQNTMVKVLRALPGEERQIELKPWLYRIAHNESIELLRRRRDSGQIDPELPAPGTGLADAAESRERLRWLLSDLDELPERQRGALVMRELGGLDFGEIAVALGTSPAVARQTLYEARLSLRQMDEGRSMSCEIATRVLSDGDGRVVRRRDVRAHLRMCASCRSFREEIEGRKHNLAALSPLPAVAAAGLLHGLLGGSHGASGGGLTGVLGGGAAKSIGTSAVLKGAATVAVVAAIGVGVADRGGLIHVGSPGDGGSQATPIQQPPRADPIGAGSSQVTGSSAAGATVPASASAAASGGGHLGASQAAKTGAGKAASGGKVNGEATAAPTSQGSSSAAHPHGKGHEKQLPSASAHGQQTAASHKTANHGTAGTQSHPAHPSKPSHPEHPSHPGTEDGPSSPSPSEATHEAQAHANAATQAAGTEEASPDHETGKKP